MVSCVLALCGFHSVELTVTVKLLQKKEVWESLLEFQIINKVYLPAQLGQLIWMDATGCHPVDDHSALPIIKAF